MNRFLSRHGVFVALAVLFAIAAIWQPAVFLKGENLRNLLSQNAAVGLLAVGMTLVIVAGAIDLSVGSMLALVAALSVLAMNKAGANEAKGIAAALGTAVVAGAGLGYLNGLLTTLGRVAPFVVTLAGLAAFRSLTLVVADGGEIRSESTDLFPGLARTTIPLNILAFLLMAVVAWVLMEKFRWGRWLVATGANERAARYAGVPTDRVKRTAYAFLGLCVGLAALCDASRVNSVSAGATGLYFELDAIAAVVIGGASLAGGRGAIPNTVAGVLFLGTLSNVLVAAGVNPYWQGFVRGVVILAAVLLQRGKRAA